MLEPAHLAVDFLQDLGALLQSKHHILLYEGKLDVGRQLLQLQQLRVRLGEQRLLELFAAQRQQRARPVALGQQLARSLGLAVCEDGDALLVLFELVALDLEVENGPVQWWLEPRLFIKG